MRQKNIKKYFAVALCVAATMSVCAAMEDAIETQIFPRAGDITWTVPEGVDTLKAEMIGGGGGGGKARVEEKWGPERAYPFQHVAQCGFGNFCKTTPIIQGPVKIHCVGCTPNPYQVVLCKWEGLSVRVNDATFIEIPEHALLHCEGMNDMKQDIVVQRLERITHQGVGGGAGQMVVQGITGLHAGDTIAIHVGDGGKNADGNATTVTANGQIYTAAGGRKEVAPTINGERGTLEHPQSSSLWGAGGRASTSPDANGENGLTGAVILTYIKPADVEILSQALELSAVYSGRIKEYLTTFKPGKKSEDELIARCVKGARSAEPRLAEQFLDIQELREQQENLSDELVLKIEAFEIMFFKTIAKSPQLKQFLLDEQRAEL